MGHGIGAHGTAEHQQDGGQNRGLDHGKGDSHHGLPLWGIQDGGGLLQVGIHVPENAANEDVGEGGIVQAQHHQAGEQSLAPPFWHGNAEERRKQAVGGAGDGVGIEQVLPHHRQGPLRHDVGENENGAQVFPPGQVGAGDEEGKNAAEENGDHAGAHRQIHGVQQGCPQILFGHSAGEQVDVVHQGVAAGFACQVGINGAGMDAQGVLHNGHNGSHGGDGDHNAQHQQNHVVGLTEIGAQLVQPDPHGTGSERIVLFHGTLLAYKTAPLDRCLPNPEAPDGFIR